MKNRKPYTPTMPKRKLENLTLITEKNIGKVMGQLNHFFSKPTLRLSGFCQKVIGVKMIEVWDDCKIPQNIYSDEYYPNYLPYEAHCHYHYIWENYLKGKEIWFSREPEKIPRLAISGKYTNGCVPISLGDSYKIYGNRLVIMHKWDKFVHSTPWLRFNEFIQIEHYDEEQLRKIRVSGCISQVIDGLYDLREGYEHKYFSYIGDYITKLSVEMEIAFKHSYHLEKVEKEITGKYEDFKLIIYPLRALNPNDTNDFMEIISEGGQKYNSCIKYIMDIIDKKMKEDWEMMQKEKENEPLDWDYDFDYGYLDEDFN